MSLANEEVLKQSQAAFGTWGPTWEKNAVTNGKIYQAEGTNFKQLMFEGIGRTLLCIGFGPSFEYNLDTLKKYNTGKYDIACVDKCLGKLLDNGITPKYVFLADSGISFDKWLKPWIEHTKDILLITNITANTEWIENWKGKRYFYTNKDNIATQDIYGPLSGCMEMIPASSNVSNSAVVFACNLMGYDQILLVGYDYSWYPGGNYYAFNAEDDENTGKRYWMKHLQMIDFNGDTVNSSQNLLFSARWLTDFDNMVARQDGIQIYNCSNMGILFIKRADLEKKLSECDSRKIRPDEMFKIAKAKMESVVVDGSEGPQRLNEVLNGKHISQIIVNYIPDDARAFMEARI